MASNQTYQTARGVRDILPNDQPYWQHFRHTAENVLEGLGIDRIDLPHFENVDVFTRGIGEETDIVQKEMYYLMPHKEDQEEPKYALRPEGTAGAVRAYIQNGMNSLPSPVRLYYMGAMFRHDRPQKGRFREFFQLGVEIFADESPKSDFLAIMSAWELLKKLGLKDLVVHVNSIGCPKCREKYIKKLKKYYKEHLGSLCENCQIRYKKNTLRLLDCKEESCRTIAKSSPVILDHMCEGCKEHFQSTLEYLDYFQINYDLNPLLVRGLDYYTRTVFEIAEEKDKERDMSLGGGGRYDGLVELLGGKDTPAVGWSLGVDRVIQVMKQQKVELPEKRGVEVCILQLGDKAKEVSKEIYDKLNENDINVYFVPSNDGLRSQIKSADKLGAKYAIIIGQKEALKDEIIIRDLDASSQEVIPRSLALSEIKKKIEA